MLDVLADSVQAPVSTLNEGIIKLKSYGVISNKLKAKLQKLDLAYKVARHTTNIFLADVIEELKVAVAVVPRAAASDNKILCKEAHEPVDPSQLSLAESFKRAADRRAMEELQNLHNMVQELLEQEKQYAAERRKWTVAFCAKLENNDEHYNNGEKASLVQEGYHKGGNRKVNPHPGIEAKDEPNMPKDDGNQMHV